MKFTVKDIAFNAIIAALYFVLTVAISPLSYGPIQFRFAEVLVLLVFFNRSYSVGLVLGCFLSNLMSPLPLDMLFGTLATLLSVVCMCFCKHLAVTIIFPTVFNAFIVALELLIAFEEPFWFSVLTVGAGELAVLVLGYGLIMALSRNNYFYKIVNANRNIAFKW